jgi:hypothetical protein
VQYLEGKAQYAANIKREKLRSWKEYCNIMANPLNEVYKLAAGKRRYSENCQVDHLPMLTTYR